MGQLRHPGAQPFQRFRHKMRRGLPFQRGVHRQHHALGANAAGRGPDQGRGTFFQTTGGNWIFVLDRSGKKAYRRNISIARQNPQYYEVTEGLEPGERVITSGYEAFKENEILILK